MGGDQGGGGQSAADYAASEERRKSGLRKQINQLYGISDASSMQAPSKSQFTTGAQPQYVYSGGTNDPDGGYSAGGMVVGGYSDPVFDQAGYDKALADFDASGGMDPVAKAALDTQKKAETTLGDSTRAFYGDQLQHSSEQAFRNNRFALADRGTLGGSAQVDTERELSRDNTLGATRIADQVASAIAGLKNSNESERLNAINLVNSGSGADAVQSAQAGLSRSLENAQSQQKANITGDLFAGGANQIAAANSAYNPLLLAQMQSKMGSFFNPGGGSARVTAT